MGKIKEGIGNIAVIALFLGIGAALGWWSGGTLITRFFGEKVSVRVEKVHERGPRETDSHAEVTYNGKRYVTGYLPMRVKAGDDVEAWYCSFTDEVVACTIRSGWIFILFVCLTLSILIIGLGVLMVWGCLIEMGKRKV